MKITVNYVYRIMGTLVIGGGSLSGCAPIPQGYPTPPSVVQQQPQVQGQGHANQVPQAAPLPHRQPAGTQRYAALPAEQAQARTQTQVAVPPVLQPVPQRHNRSATVNTATGAASGSSGTIVAQRQHSAIQSRQRYQTQGAISRSSTSKTRAIPSVSPTKKAVSRPTVNKSVKEKAAVSKRATPAVRMVKPVKPVKPAPVPAAPQKKAEVEVLDMTRQTNKPTVQEKRVPPPPAPVYRGNPAVTVLTKQANNQLVAGKTGQAASTLERALRIDPENPMLWLRLAEVNEKQGNKIQAASMAKKAMILAPSDNNIKQRGRRLLN